MNGPDDSPAPPATRAHKVDTGAPPGPRRPPRPPAGWASVTYLGIGSDPLPRPVPLAPVDGSLALAAEPVPAHPAPTRPATPDLRLVPGTGPGGGPGSGPDEVSAWAARFAQGVVEVLGGDRPLQQLVRWTSRRVYLDLERRVRILTRSCPSDQRLRTVRAQVRSVHVCHPTAEAAEVSVHVRHGRRSRALAARLELVQGRWQCTALQLG